MNLLLSFIPLVWLSQGLQTELMHDDGHFNYDRFWSPDVRVKIDEYHLWCWNGAGLKFTDQDLAAMFNGDYPTYTALTAQDKQTCGG